MHSSMRISDSEQQIIKDAVFALDPQARIYLFSSRANDSKRGGDIDLLIATDTQAPFVREALKNSVELR